MRLVSCLVGLCVLALVGGTAGAQSYPNRPIRMVVPFAPGGLNDVLARIISPKLSESLGQPIIVENRGGAGSNLGTEYVARAAPDGYTLLLSSSALAINPNLYAKLNYDVARDFAPIIQISTTQMVVLVAPSVPVGSVRELLTLAKSSPGKLNYGSSGIGSPSHLATELFIRTFGLQAAHVPYKGAGPALVALSAGEVQMMVDVLPTALPLAKGGKAKILAVVAHKRASSLPEVPTLAEAGVAGYESGSWNGILAPAATPRPIISRLGAELQKIMGSAEMRQRFRDLSVEPEATTPEEFGQFIRAETARWEKLIKPAGIRAE
jgi:tripartite-type tricarboxylate transporter receptor subunit TctC